MAGIVAIIPARLNSKRFPRKVIYPFRGKPLLYYVVKEVARAKTISRVIVATDSDEVVNSVEGFGGEVMRTSSRHATGSDRVAEVAGKLKASMILNVQADNFGLKAPVLDRMVESVRQNRSIQFATLASRLNCDKDLFDPNVVKIVMAADGRALWFSRFPIPYVRDIADMERVSQFKFYGHIGVYLYRRAALMRFEKWGQTVAEKAESLEQLRVLEHGEKMKVFNTKMRTVSIDTPEDLKKLDSIYR